MPGKQDDRPSVKNDDQYEALRDQGMSKEKAARIANAQAQAEQGQRKSPSEKGGESPKYEERTFEELQERAQEIGIEGRSKMNKDELIDALRNH